MSARLTPTARSSRDPLSLKETFLISNIRGNYRLTSLLPVGSVQLTILCPLFVDSLPRIHTRPLFKLVESSSLPLSRNFSSDCACTTNVAFCERGIAGKKRYRGRVTIGICVSHQLPIRKLRIADEKLTASSARNERPILGTIASATTWNGREY